MEPLVPVSRVPDSRIWNQSEEAEGGDMAIRSPGADEAMFEICDCRIECREE